VSPVLHPHSHCPQPRSVAVQTGTAAQVHHTVASPSRSPLGWGSSCWRPAEEQSTAAGRRCSDTMAGVPTMRRLVVVRRGLACWGWRWGGMGFVFGKM
jgi:hypothetical protein